MLPQSDQCLPVCYSFYWRTQRKAFEILNHLKCIVLLSGKLKHAELDERALDALKEFAAADAIQVLKQVVESNLGHVTNKSAYLCGQMKTYRQKMKSGGANPTPKGPDETKLKVSKNL